MSTLLVYRGLPGSGKSTASRFVQALAPDTTVVVNRDSIRKRLFGDDSQDYYDCGKDILYRKEKLVTEAQHTEITAALKAGFDVVNDDTNLPVKRCRDLRALATKAGAKFVVDSSFADVPLGVCLARNEARERKVPAEVLISMYDRFIRGGLAPLPDEEPEKTRFKPYHPDTTLPVAVCVDTDGTLANHEPHRSPYDTSKYHEDTVFQDVVDVVRFLQQSGVKIIGLSGRSEDFRQVTLRWWNERAGLMPDAFYMRKSGDTRRDDVVKSEMFDENVSDYYNVIGVIDDRIRVLEMWEDKGLTTFRVGGINGGDF